MKKGNSLILVIVLSFFFCAYLMHANQKKQHILLHDNYSYSKLKNELNETKEKLNNQRYISLLLFNYADYKKVKKDSVLMNRMFNATEK
jgi:c-di-AMP phosphodiesterase-like protein